MNKLYVTDLDGTLLRSDIKVSNYSQGILNRLIDQGINITFSTSRSFYTASMLLKKIRFSLPCITYNGAYIIHAKSGEIIKKNLLDIDVYTDILKQCSKFKLTPFVFGIMPNNSEKLVYDVPCNKAQVHFIQERMNRNDKRLQKTDSNLKLNEIINLSFLYPLDNLLPFKNYVSEIYGSDISIKLIKDIYNNDYYTLEIANKNANKGSALTYIGNQLGVMLKDITVFGDQSNDLEMFSVAGTGVAVQNATDELKKKATIIIESNDNDGVAKYLAQYTT